MRGRGRRMVIGVLAVLLAALPGTAVAAPDDLPEHVPAAAQGEAPTLPAMDAWPFPETFPAVAGTGRLDGGALLWTDFLHDDHGAAQPIANPLHPRTLDKGLLAPANGSYAYADEAAAGNGADVFRAGVGRGDDAIWFRVDWSTLLDASVPLAVWTFDTDDDSSTGTADWPAGANVTSAGWDRALVVSSSSATLVDAAGGTTDVTDGLTVDTGTRSFLVEVPTTTLPVDGTWRVRLGVGVADEAGTALAAPTLGAAPLDSQLFAGVGRPALYNVAFRTREQEPERFTDGDTVALTSALEDAIQAVPPADAFGLGEAAGATILGNMWREDHQADALAAGDVSEFSVEVDWAALGADRTTSEAAPSGWSTRWYTSELDLGQGVVPDATPGSGDLEPQFPDVKQQYSIYVPSSYRPGTPAPLTWILHSLSVNHMQYAAFNPRMVEQLCEDRGAICVTTLGRGPDGWYFDEAETDFWEVWRDVATHYDLDPDRTTLSGYSMGGFGTYKLGWAHPDMFAAAMVLGAPTSCGFSVADGFRAEQDDGTPCGSDGRTLPLVGNSRWLPVADGKSVIDELAPFTQTVEMIQALDDLGYRYDLTAYPAGEHLLLAVQDRFDQVVAAVPERERTVDPGVFEHTWYPDLDMPDLGIGATGVWYLDDLAARDTAPGVLARIAVDAASNPDPAITVTRTGADLATEPFPAGQRRLTWDLGEVPAAEPRIDLDLTNVDGFSLATDRAGFTCGTIAATSDGDTTVTLTGLAPGEAIARDGATIGTVADDGTAAVTFAEGTSEVEVCAASAGPAPAPAPDPSEDDAPLAATGGGAGLTALALLGIAAALRRRHA